jgi:hypothetical protein
VSRQLGHHDASITLRVYAHWVPDTSTAKAVDRLDDTQPSATQTQPPSKGVTAIRHSRGRGQLTGVLFDLPELYVVRNRQFPLAGSPARSAGLYSTGR